MHVKCLEECLKYSKILINLQFVVIFIFFYMLKYSDDKGKIGSLVKIKWAIDLNIFSINLLSEFLKEKKNIFPMKITLLFQEDFITSSSHRITHFYKNSLRHSEMCSHFGNVSVML